MAIPESPKARAPTFDQAEVVTRSHIEGLRRLSTDLSNEIKALDKYITASASNPSPKPLTTNSPYLLAVWGEVLGARDIIAVGRTLVIPVPIAEAADRSNVNAALEKQSPSPKPQNALVKVDIVAECGKRWTRINTITKDRLVRELYELDLVSDSSASGSDDNASPDDSSRLPLQTECSIVRMARELLRASSIDPLTPEVHIRFSRLFPNVDTTVLDHLLRPESSVPGFPPEVTTSLSQDDTLVLRPIRQLVSMGVSVHFGSVASVDNSNITPAIREPRPIATKDINLDLSLLVALCSDIAHAPLPSSLEKAEARFRSLSRKQRRDESRPAPQRAPGSERFDGKSPKKDGLGEHARSLVAQVMQETQHSLIDEIHERCYPRIQQSPISPVAVSFWTTEEARDRFLAIVDKIGGPLETQRAYALFGRCPSHGEDGGILSNKEATRIFWRASRFPPTYIEGLVPIRIHHPAPTTESHNGIVADDLPDDTGDRSGRFIRRLRITCSDLLSFAPPTATKLSDPPTPLPDMAETPTTASHTEQSPRPSIDPFEPAQHLKLGPSVRSSITSHTLRSLLVGLGSPVITPPSSPKPSQSSGVETLSSSLSSPATADRGMMTTLTANRSSVQTILRRMTALFPAPISSPSSSSSLDHEPGVLWIVEPRSLAEAMRAE